MVLFPWQRRAPRDVDADRRAEWVALDVPAKPPLDAYVAWTAAEVERFDDHVEAGTRAQVCASSPDGQHWRHFDHVRCRYCAQPWDIAGEDTVPGGWSPVCWVHQVAPDASVPGGCRCNR